MHDSEFIVGHPSEYHLLLEGSRLDFDFYRQLHRARKNNALSAVKNDFAQIIKQRTRQATGEYPFFDAVTPEDDSALREITGVADIAIPVLTFDAQATPRAHKTAKS